MLHHVCSGEKGVWGGGSAPPHWPFQVCAPGPPVAELPLGVSPSRLQTPSWVVFFCLPKRIVNKYFQVPAVCQTLARCWAEQWENPSPALMEFTF